MTAVPADPAAPPGCPDHGVDLEWRDGQPLPGYDPRFRPLGWTCPADPGHPLSPAPADPGHPDWCKCQRVCGGDQ